jgi:hypothetical protein
MQPCQAQLTPFSNEEVEHPSGRTFLEDQRVGISVKKLQRQAMKVWLHAGQHWLRAPLDPLSRWTSPFIR